MSDIQEPVIPVFYKTPGEKLAYTFDWSEWLAKEGAEMVGYALGVGLGVDTTGIVREGDAITIGLAAGRVGYTCHITCTIDTGSQTVTRTIHVTIVAQR